MRMSDIFRLGIDALEFAIVILMLFLITWGCGYKLIYQKMLHGKKRLTIKKLIPHSLLGMVVLVILYATLFRGNYWGVAPSLIPFSSYRLAWYQGNIREWRNLILNICMFVPFGFVLPLTNKKLRNSWKVYLVGFAFSLIIEITQLVFKRGIFEADDMINNLLGTMIGYGIYAIVSSFYIRKITKEMIFCQIPLAGVIVIGVVLSWLYNSQELGNVIYENVSRHEMPDISFDENIKMEDENITANIYKTSILSEEETHRYVEKLFALQGKKIDESRTDIYDETAVYYSYDGSISIWMDYKGGTLRYTDFSLRHPTDGSNCKYLLEAEEEIVQRAVMEIGVDLPENTIFYSNENKYTFEVKDDENGEAYYTGYLICELNDEGKVVTLTSNIIRGELYKTVDIISPQRAFDLVSQGLFFSEDNVSKENSLILFEMNLTYICDSKGFYQPAYEFIFRNELSEEEKIYIMAKEDS